MTEIKCVAFTYAKPDGRVVATFTDRSRTNYARLIAAVKIRRSLEGHEVVHHHDGDPSNDAWQNIVVLPRGAHTQLHGPDSKVAQWDNASCGRCGCPLDDRTIGCSTCTARHIHREKIGRPFIPARHHCVTCGVPFDEQTPGCGNCRQRHSHRGRNYRKALA